MTTKEINPDTITPEAARAEIEYLLKFGTEAQRAREEAKKPQTFNFGGEEWLYSDGRIQRYEPAKPDKLVRPGTFETFSLDGLIDYIISDVDNIFDDGGYRHIVRVTSPTRVEVISPVTGYWKERITVAICDAVVPDIMFGRYMDTDDFQIMVQTCFEDSENRAKVLLLAGNLKKEQSMQTADDGVSQRVTVNAGVCTVADVTVKNPVTLTPFRTFREVKQPASPFILRFNEEARAALFTGDGSVWKLEAVARIKEYLKAKLDGYGVEIIA